MGLSDVDGNIVVYQWNLGDGIILFQVEVLYVYEVVGIYQISLIVIDNDGLINFVIIFVQVINEVLVVVIDVMVISYNIGDIVFFSVLGLYDNDGIINCYEWDFGNGDIVEGQLVSYVYLIGGNYIVMLIVIDDVGVFNSININVIVNDFMVFIVLESLIVVVNGFDVILSWINMNNNVDYFVIECVVKFCGKICYEFVGIVVVGSIEYIDLVLFVDNYWYWVIVVNVSYEVILVSIQVLVSELFD